MKEWYDAKIYKCSYQLELDKDLLVKGNKMYKPSACCFIPKEINVNLNYTRNNAKHMKYLYEKYKSELPDYILQKIYQLSKGEE